MNSSFQCSSASRKFLNRRSSRASASATRRFQCSSASRKFLNCDRNSRAAATRAHFSALQRAENSSIQTLRCNEARIDISVLFSEPKIPQSRCSTGAGARCWHFSALQRAENSSIAVARATRFPRRQISVLFSEPKIPQSYHLRAQYTTHAPFQCSSASRKFLNAGALRVGAGEVEISVLFSEPKIPQFLLTILTRAREIDFSALQRAENSSMPIGYGALEITDEFQCSSASRKFLN